MDEATESKGEGERSKEYVLRGRALKPHCRPAESKDSKKQVENPDELVGGKETCILVPALPRAAQSQACLLPFSAETTCWGSGRPAWTSAGPVGQLGITVWQVALANPRESLGGAGKDAPARLWPICQRTCVQQPHGPRPHPTMGKDSRWTKGSLGLTTG